MKKIFSPRRHRYLARVSTFLITVALIAGMVGCGGDGGTPSQNLEIYDWYDLNAVRNNLTGSYLLMNDLNSTTPGYTELASPTANSGKGWQPIGEKNVTVTFIGIFDGQGYEISDLFIDRPEEDYVGLFRRVIGGGVVRNVGVVNVAVTGGNFTGGLVGWNYGTVSNSYSTGSVTGNSSVGGLVGINNYGCTVDNCYVTGSVSGNSAIGGLVGANTGSIIDSSSAASVTGTINTGGLVGGNVYTGTISNSYSTGNVTGTINTGGLVGDIAHNSTISNSYSTGSVTGFNYTGGLVGKKSGGFVSNSFWDTQTSGQATSASGTGKNTTEMQDIMTFSGAGWDITTVGGIGERNTTYIWNIVHTVTYPFLSWQP
jgi:hypothetical protein